MNPALRKLLEQQISKGKNLENMCKSEKIQKSPQILGEDFNSFKSPIHVSSLNFSIKIDLLFSK